jgi:hypothetical protein
MPQILKDSAELLFTGELVGALHVEGVDLSNPAQTYVVRLLSDIRRYVRRPVNGYPLAPLYLKAVQRGEGRFHDVMLRDVGDTALLLSGWWWRFTESNRYGPGVDYHIDLGWSAYRLIDREPYGELAKCFAKLVNALAQMTVRIRECGERELLGTIDDVVLYDLYSYYCRTQSRQAERLLKKNGFDIQSNAKPQ